jgi:sialidase-1
MFYYLPIFLIFSNLSSLYSEDVGVVTEFQVLFDQTTNESVACYRIPSLITTKTGDLIAAIDERVPSCGDLKWSRDINIVLRRSTDNGNTWSDVIRIVDYHDGKSASDPSMILDKETGELFLFYNYMDHDKEKDVYYLHVMRSNDHGKTWSPPEDITNQISKPDWHHDFKFITSGRGIQTSNGKLLHCLVNLEKGMHLFGSNDHGDSWFLYDEPLIPGNESKVVELSDGTWMINCRTNGSGLRYIHTSTDEGKTWNNRPDSTLVDPGCNGSILKYPNQDILIFSHLNDRNKRQNLVIRYSLDDGISWSEGRTVYPGSAAYSAMSVLANGEIGLFFEKDDYSENVFVSLPPDWILGK